MSRGDERRAILIFRKLRRASLGLRLRHRAAERSQYIYISEDVFVDMIELLAYVQVHAVRFSSRRSIAVHLSQMSLNLNVNQSQSASINLAIFKRRQKSQRWTCCCASPASHRFSCRLFAPFSHPYSISPFGSTCFASHITCMCIAHMAIPPMSSTSRPLCTANTHKIRLLGDVGYECDGCLLEVGSYNGSHNGSHDRTESSDSQECHNIHPFK